MKALHVALRALARFRSHRGLQLFAVVLAISVGACAGILGLKSSKNQQHPFEHRKHLTAGINCLRCHESVKTAGGESTLHIPGKQECLSCHSKPHDENDCSNCHGSDVTRSAAIGAIEHLRFEHKKHLGRVEGQCVPCHTEAGSLDPTSLRPAMAQCFTCHEHRDQWAVNDCAGCHKNLASEHVKPSTHIVHEGNWLKEHGVRAAAARDLCAACHSESTCASCHGVTVAALPWKLKFDQPSFNNLHAAGFFQRHPDEARAQPGLCTTCHSPENFCQTCHDSNKVSATSGAKSPHPPGWVRAKGGDHGKAARLDPVECASCHGGAGEMLCVGCHKVGGAGGNPHGPGFSSKLNKTQDVPCKLCHSL